MSWALGDLYSAFPIAWLAVAIAAVAVVRIVCPGRASAETLTIMVLCVTAGIAYLQWRTLEKTDKTMRSQQRAILAPRGLEIPENFRTGTIEDTQIEIRIENVGKEPATKTNETLFATNLPLGEFRNPEWVESIIRGKLEGRTCKSDLPLNRDGRAIYPGARVGHVVDLFKPETEKALARTDFAMVAGCLVYETLDERHYSEVCAVLEPLKNGGWRSTQCITHNGAD